MKKAIYVIITFLLLIGCGFFLYGYANKNGELNFFSIQNGNDVYTSTSENVSMQKGVVNVFNIKAPVSQAGYSVKILPNPKIYLDFTMDGLSHFYSVVTDLSTGFNLKVYDTYFILSFPKNATLQAILQKQFPDKHVLAPDMEQDEDYFLLQVISRDKKNTINIYFH